MKTKTLSLLLALTFCVGLAVPALAAEKTYTATFTEDGVSVTVHNVIRESVVSIPDIYGVFVGEKTVYWVPAGGAYLSIEFDESIYPGSDHWIKAGISDENVYGSFDFAFNVLPGGNIEQRWESQSMGYSSLGELSEYPLNLSGYSVPRETEDGEFDYVNEVADGTWFISRFIGQSVSNPHTVICFGFVDEEIQEPAEAPSSWAVESVNNAIAAGLVPDNLQGKYTQATTRAEFCALAVALYQNTKNSDIPITASFSDTTDENVLKMAALGVVNGIGDNKFDPDAKLTREQAATMLSRLANAIEKPLNAQAATFVDSDSVSSWAADAVGQMQATGIMGGVGNNTFAPKSDYTREQSIVTMMRLFEIVK